MLLEMATRELIVQARQHPYRTLGAALSAGYVVGAGLPFFAVRLLRTMLVRSAAQAVLSHTIDGQSVIRTALAATTSVPVK